MLHPNERIRAPALDDVPGQWRRAAAGAAGSAFGACTRRGTPRPEFVLTCVPRRRQGGRVQRTPVRLARLLLCDGKRTRIAPSGTTHRSPVEVRPRATRRPVSAQYDPGLFQKQRMILSCAIQPDGFGSSAACEHRAYAEEALELWPACGPSLPCAPGNAPGTARRQVLQPAASLYPNEVSRPGNALSGHPGRPLLRSFRRRYTPHYGSAARSRRYDASPSKHATHTCTRSG